jgi:NAD(P)-dependent dehydrogenase (short-subunit alcohol dehydrogenase family)
MQEHFTTEDFQKLFDVNVFGVQRVNRAALPHLRKQGSGLIIYISSLLGRITMPFYGPYNASKWAVEALAENYRFELSGFGVDSCIVEPGGFETTFFESLLGPSDESRNESYGEFMNAPQQLIEGFAGALAANKEQNPQYVADAISKLISTPSGQRPLRTAVDNMGMGAAIQPYNDMLDQITASIHGNFGMGDMLKLKV